MVRKVFCMFTYILYNITISLLTLDQKHDEYEDCINALRIHFCIILAAKISQEIEMSNSLEEKNVIFV
jgi:hypothetical protein